MPGTGKICAVVASPHAADMRRQLRTALKIARFVEIRLDWLVKDDAIEGFLKWLTVQKHPKTTVIATCRRREGGGKYRGSVAKQLAHLWNAVRAGCNWYDLEVETTQKCPPELLEVMLGEGRQLRSAHFFKHIPRDLKGVAAQLRLGKPDAIKIAARCGSLGESLRLLKFAASEENIVAIPMGEIAAPVRIRFAWAACLRTRR